jgi:hypothetical protein
MGIDNDDGNRLKIAAGWDGDWAVNKTKMVLEPGGHMGVGTSTPKGDLHVNGSLIVGPSRDDDNVSGHGTISFNLLNYFTQEASSHDDGTYIHIRTPFRPDDESRMFHFTVSGYAYNSENIHKIIDLKFAGYAKDGSVTRADVWDATMAFGLANGYFQPAVYKGSDGHVWLRFWVKDKYFMTYRVDSMFVGNGRVVQAGELSQQTNVAILGNEEM